MDENDLGAGEGSTGNSGSQSVRKNIPIKLKGGKPKGKTRKTATPKGRKTVSRKATQDAGIDEKNVGDEELPDQLEFSTMKIATPGEPLHRNHKLKWDHKVNLIGQKVVDPLIHSCEKCALPILIYGRMIPCKHVFCFDCAKKTEKHCPRCKETVSRIEQSALGTVFVCTYGGSKHGTTGCHRTYLSQRDLQAHIDHRHIKSSKDKSSSAHSSQPQNAAQLTVNQKSAQQSLATPPQASMATSPHIQQTPPQQSASQQLPVMAHTHESYIAHSGVASLSVAPHGSPAQPQTISMNMTAMQGPPPQPQQQQPQMQDSSMIYHHAPRQDEHQAQQSGMMLSQPPPATPVQLPLMNPMQHHQQPPPQQAPHPAIPPQPNLMQPPPQVSTTPTHLPPPPAASTNMDNYHNIPTMAPTRNTNLITVPIQDERDYARRDQPAASYSQPVPQVAGGPSLYSHPPPGPPPQGHYTHPPPALPPSSYPSHQHGAAGGSVSLPGTFSSPPPAHGGQYQGNAPPPQRPHMQVPPPQVGPIPQTGPPPRPSPQVPPPSSLRPPLSGPPPQMGGPPPHGPPPQYPPNQRPPAGPFDQQGSSHPWPSQGPPPRGPPPPRPQTSSSGMGPPHGYYQ